MGGGGTWKWAGFLGEVFQHRSAPALPMTTCTGACAEATHSSFSKHTYASSFADFQNRTSQTAMHCRCRHLPNGGLQGSPHALSEGMSL